MIDLTEYQETIKQFYTPEVSADLLTYSRELLVSEVGEVIGLRAKKRRGDARLQDDSAYRAAAIDEMGGCIVCAGVDLDGKRSIGRCGFCLHRVT